MRVKLKWLRAWIISPVLNVQHHGINSLKLQNAKSWKLTMTMTATYPAHKMTFHYKLVYEHEIRRRYNYILARSDNNMAWLGWGQFSPSSLTRRIERLICYLKKKKIEKSTKTKVYHFQISHRKQWLNPIEILRFENHSRDESVFGDRWRDTGVKCYVGTLVTILVCTQLCLMILHIMFKLQTTKPQQF